MDPERIKLPGFGLPLNHEIKSFPCAVLDWLGEPLTVRELNMMLDWVSQVLLINP